MDAWYVIHLMQEFLRDEEDLLLPTSLQGRTKDMANANSAEIRAEFRRIQRTICTIIKKDVCTVGGLLFYGHTLPSNDEIETRLVMIRDETPFNTLEEICPFPPKKLV